ncbi:MAG: hypothetical protein PWQ57_890 [Desulfovibrionales bacterium]|nr:hypothetical protein [Desulfovibrionales bacterium]
MDHRKPCAASTITLPGRPPVRIELFDAMLWPQAPGARAGLYRVRRDRVWIMAPDKFTFFTPTALGRLLAAELAAGLSNGLPGAPEPAPPELAVGDSVRLRAPGRMEPGAPIGWRYGRVIEAPLQTVDGRWSALVYFWDGRRTERIDVALLERVRRAACQG